MKTLVIVDYQFDFYDPAGTLHVEHGEDIVDCIAAAMPAYDNIVFTLDWHPYNHCSFVQQGGPWPEHCVQYTPGAGIHPLLIKTAITTGKNITIYRKAFYPDFEEYGGFIECVDPTQQRYTTGTPPKDFFDISDEIAVCGLAAGYCVDETVLNLIRAGYGPKVVLLSDGIGKLCTEEQFQSFITANGLRVI